ncbi:hypothetical protein Celaphus_00008548 [Cervus elaphus hippelaphus]|uniref:FAM50A/XAP5 C-terminal domain-containing protein n=1 Tax=Cervus elaphus hippelaphus TaxID=46360 RepID=A0A212CQ61_CEREH|nr:hypothetical protein Celaphus_00008548 [Cervus elaphus hippelaphus]
MHLMKKQEKQREQMEQMKQRIAEENIMKSNIDKKFSAHYDAVEAELKSSTVGLVTLNDMKAKQEALMKKGNTMQQFLQKALEILRKDFSELRSAGVEQLIFDVHDHVRLLSDATVEKDESHAGKVVLRSWYEKNKHIFPASRWEPYDPEKKWDKYTIR